MLFIPVIFHSFHRYRPYNKLADSSAFITPPSIRKKIIIQCNSCNRYDECHQGFGRLCFTDSNIHIGPTGLFSPGNLSAYVEDFPILLCNISQVCTVSMIHYNTSLLENYFISLLFVPICYMIFFSFKDNFSYFSEAKETLN